MCVLSLCAEGRILLCTGLGNRGDKQLFAAYVLTRKLASNNDLELSDDGRSKNEGKNY